MLGVNERMDLKLFGREIVFEEFQRMWSRYLIVTDRRTDRRTDGRTTCNLITRSVLALRGKKDNYFHSRGNWEPGGGSRLAAGGSK